MENLQKIIDILGCLLEWLQKKLRLKIKADIVTHCWRIIQNLRSIRSIPLFMTTWAWKQWGKWFFPASNEPIVLWDEFAQFVRPKQAKFKSSIYVEVVLTSNPNIFVSWDVIDSSSGQLEIETV